MQLALDDRKMCLDRYKTGKKISCISSNLNYKIWRAKKIDLFYRIGKNVEHFLNLAYFCFIACLDIFTQYPLCVSHTGRQSKSIIIIDIHLLLLL